MAVAIRIQHAAGRDAPLHRLLVQLPQAVEVVTDSDPGPPNPWRGYQKCLSNLPADGHVCVLQDDAIVCQNFVPALELIAAANPGMPVILFLGGQPRRTATRVRAATERYVDLAPNDFMPVVAVLWPVAVAKEFLGWTEANQLRMPRGGRSDDAIAGRWLRFTHQRVRVAVPSLVQHPDDFPSTITKRARGGLDKGRVAVNWIGDGDPLALDWSLERNSPSRVRFRPRSD